MSWQLWDRIRAYIRRGNLYQADQILQDQTALDRLTQGGQIIDFSRQSSILNQTNLQINRLERYKDFDQMDEVGEITLALDMYADESSLMDPEEGHSIIVKAKSKRVKTELEDLFFDTLLIDRYLRPLARYLCKYGDFAAEIVLTQNRDAVQSFRFMNVYNVTRVETRFGDLVGFFFQDQLSGEPVFLHPWQVMHLRLTSYENIYHPYGRSILDGARKDFKRLRLMEDAALIYRITRAPEKRIFSIPVGNIPPREVPQYMELIARQFKNKKFVDPATGSVNERFSPLIQEDDFFLPKRPDGSGPTIDTLPGAENLDAIADIEYFKKKMISALKIPFSRVGLGEPSDADGKSLASVSPEFAKAIQWIQREIAVGLKKIAIVHLSLKGYPIEDIKNFDIHMTAASAIDELYRIETWSSRADVISRLMDTQQFESEWLLTKFTDLTSDEVKDMQKKRAAEISAMQPDLAAGAPGGDMGADIGAGAQPLELGAPAEEVDTEFEQLITEYEQFLDRGEETDYFVKQKTEIMEDIKGMSRGLKHFLDQNELDGLPSPNSKEGKEELLVEHSVGEETRNEVMEQTKQLIQELGVSEEIMNAASSIEDNWDEMAAD